MTTGLTAYVAAYNELLATELTIENVTNWDVRMDCLWLAAFKDVLAAWNAAADIDDFDGMRAARARIDEFYAMVEEVKNLIKPFMGGQDAMILNEIVNPRLLLLDEDDNVIATGDEALIEAIADTDYLERCFELPAFDRQAAVDHLNTCYNIEIKPGVISDLVPTTYREVQKLGKAGVLAMLDDLEIDYDTSLYYYKLCSLLWKQLK